MTEEEYILLIDTLDPFTINHIYDRLRNAYLAINDAKCALHHTALQHTDFPIFWENSNITSILYYYEKMFGKYQIPEP